VFFFFSSRRRHTRLVSDWSSDVCSSDLDLIERVGLEDAQELWALSKEGAEHVRAIATEEAMPGIALSDGALEVSNVDAGETLIHRLQMLSSDFDTIAEGWQIERVRNELRTDRYFHGIYYPKAFQL